jgi:tetratricopeptide (TPR) repeat protein
VRDAAVTAEKVMPWLDERARAWKRARTEVCLNADVRALWRADLVDRASWCLEDRQLELESLVDELGRADAKSMQKAVWAVAGLRTVEPCLNEDMLRRQPAPPAQGREAIRDVREGFSRADSLAVAGRYKEALTVATGARERVQGGIDWPPLLAAALAHEGELLERTGVFDEAEATITRAYFAASRSGAWDVAATGAIDLIRLVGDRKARHAEGRLWAQHAEMALEHAGDRAGPNEARRLSNLAMVVMDTDAFAEAQQLLERALTIGEQALGPTHPNVAGTLGNLATLHMHMGAPTKARPLYERALAIDEQQLGPGHPSVAYLLNNLAIMHQLAGEHVEARALYERALQIREQALGPDDPDIAGTLNNLANLLEVTGEYAQARALHERALAIAERTLGPDHPDVAQSLYNIATVHIATGDFVNARSLLERALVIQERALGPDSLTVASTLDSLGKLRLAELRPLDALPLLERAGAIYAASEGSQEGENRLRLHLAMARLATGGDRAGALELARSARDGLREEGAEQARVLAEAEKWLASQEAGQ